MRLRSLAVVAGAVVALVAASLAGAAFTSWKIGGPMALSSATLAAPTGLSASCSNNVAHLSWTATSSTWADGYEVLRSTTSGGPYTSVALVSGRTTTSYNDSLPGSSRYYYVVRAKKNNWRSANSNETSVEGWSC